MGGQINIRDWDEREHDLSNDASCWCKPKIVVIAIRRDGRKVKVARHRGDSAKTLGR